MARSSIVRPHLYHSTAPLFRVYVILFLGSSNPPGLVRDLSNQASDPSTASLLTRIECGHSIPGIGLDGLVSPPSDPPLPSAPLHRSANRAPSTPGIELGGLDHTSLLPHAPPFFHGRYLRRLPPPRAIQGHHRLLLRPKTFVGSISAYEIAADSLASSGNGAVDTGVPPVSYTHLTLPTILLV